MDNLPGFQPVAPVPDELIERSRCRVVPEMVDIWTNQGFGMALDGFLKIINPDEYSRRLFDSLPRTDLVPMMTTGMGDVIVWDETEKGTRVLQYRNGCCGSRLGRASDIFRSSFRTLNI